MKQLLVKLSAAAVMGVPAATLMTPDNADAQTQPCAPTAPNCHVITPTPGTTTPVVNNLTANPTQSVVTKIPRFTIGLSAALNSGSQTAGGVGGVPEGYEATATSPLNLPLIGAVGEGKTVIRQTEAGKADMQCRTANSTMAVTAQIPGDDDGSATASAYKHMATQCGFINTVAANNKLLDGAKAGSRMLPSGRILPPPAVPVAITPPAAAVTAPLAPVDNCGAKIRAITSVWNNLFDRAMVNGCKSPYDYKPMKIEESCKPNGAPTIIREAGCYDARGRLQTGALEKQYRISQQDVNAARAETARIINAPAPGGSK